MFQFSTGKGHTYNGTERECKMSSQHARSLVGIELQILNRKPVWDWSLKEYMVRNRAGLVSDGTMVAPYPAEHHVSWKVLHTEYNK